MEKQGSLIIMGDFNNEAKRIGEGYDLVKTVHLVCMTHSFWQKTGMVRIQ